MKLPVSKIKLNPDNPRIIKDDKYKKLVQSLKEFPEMTEIRELVLNKDHVILGGNMRFRAMQEAGWKEVPVKIVDWPEDKAKEFIIKDNSNFGEWDWDILANQYELEDLEVWGVELPMLDRSDQEDIESTELDNSQKLNLDIGVFDSNNDFEIPVIKKATTIPKDLERFNGPSELQKVVKGDAIHFFAQDYKFETLWSNPHRGLEELERIGLVLSPDFSIPNGAPMPVQLWQVYRNRWLGAWWNEHGIEVIPTIGWTNIIFDFHFMGVEKGSIVAISGTGVVDKETFVRGFEEMVKTIEPSNIICYGSLKKYGIIDSRIINFKTRWETKKWEVEE